MRDACSRTSWRLASRRALDVGGGQRRRGLERLRDRADAFGIDEHAARRRRRTRAGHRCAWPRPGARWPWPRAAPARRARRGSAGRPRRSLRSTPPPGDGRSCRRRGPPHAPRAARAGAVTDECEPATAVPLEGVRQSQHVLSFVEAPDVQEEGPFAVPADAGARLDGIPASEAVEVDPAVDDRHATRELGELRLQLAPEVVRHGDHRGGSLDGEARRFPHARDLPDVANSRPCAVMTSGAPETMDAIAARAPAGTRKCE